MNNRSGYHITQDAVSSLQERIQWSKWEKKSPTDPQTVDALVLLSLNHLSYVPVLLSDSLDVQVLLSPTHLGWCPCTAFSDSPDVHVLLSPTHLMSMYFSLWLSWADVHVPLSLTHLNWCPCTSLSDSPELMSMYRFLWLTRVDVPLSHLSWCPCTALSDSPELMSMYFFVRLTWAGATPACSGWSWPPPSAALHCGYAPWQLGSRAHGSASATAHRSVDQFITKMSFMHYSAVCPSAAKDPVGFRQWRQT